MKKHIILLAVSMLLFWACQQPSKVVVTMTGPQVDNVKKTLDAYAAADWDTYRAAFADTAMIMFNSTMLDVDSLIRFQKARRNFFDNVAVETDATEYVRYENGDEYTHFWGRLVLKIKGTGREVIVPIHIADHIIDGKTVEQYAYYNTAEATAAIQEATVPPSPPVK